MNTEDTTALSRNEDILEHILAGSKDGLPVPQSRIEVLLLSLLGAIRVNVEQMSADDTDVTLDEGKFYNFPEMAALTIECPTTGGEYIFRFISGATPTTLTITGITMPDDFAVEANKVYEINVFEGYGVAVSWSAS